MDDIAALAVTDGNIIVGDGSNWVAESGATARTSLGLGTIATQASSNVTISGGTIDSTAIGSGTPSSGDFTTLSTTGAFTVGGDFDLSGAARSISIKDDEAASLDIKDGS